MFNCKLRKVLTKSYGTWLEDRVFNYLQKKDMSILSIENTPMALKAFIDVMGGLLTSLVTSTIQTWCKGLVSHW